MTKMKNVFVRLPVYTGDVSGAASALYELGGMCVIHDPSGCNSTYNTHDEVRWYDRESLIYISGLSEVDAITGNDEKFIHDTVDAAEKLKPKFIAIFCSPVPYLNGTDFKAIAKVIEKRSGISTFHIETNAMHDYTIGAANAFLRFAEKFLDSETAGKPKENSPRINVLGLTPLDFTVKESAGRIRKTIAEAGFELVSLWAMDADFDELMKAPTADVNLVISSTGFRLAEFMHEKYGIPYVVGVPEGKLADRIFDAVRQSCNDGECRMPYLEVLKKYRGKAETAVVGEAVTAGSLGASVCLEKGAPVRIVNTAELVSEKLLGEDDSYPRGEDEITAEIRKYNEIYADPLFEIVCNKDTEFHRVPHLAYSGRVYLEEMK